MILFGALLLLAAVNPALSAVSDKVTLIKSTSGAITPDLTTEVSIICVPDASIIASINNLTIYKVSHGKLEWIAKLLKKHEAVINTNYSVHANGTIGSQQSLTVTWKLASFRTFGTYRCIAYSNGVQLNSSDLVIGNTNDLWRLVARFADQIGSCPYEGLKGQRHGLPGQTSPNQKGRPLRRKPSRLPGYSLSYFPKGLPSDVSAMKLLIWPNGTYGTLAPVSGCPTEDLGEWETGMRKQSTNSNYDQPSKNERSKPNHLPVDFFNMNKEIRMANWRWCLKTAKVIPEIEWPSGSFCILKYRECPPGFTSGTIYFDDEDTLGVNSFTNPKPDGVFDGNTRFFYCCRDDGAANQEIYLPTLAPFYLFRYGGQCQKVFGMVTVEEYVIIDTETGSNQDGRSGRYPDSTINDVRLELCYYERADISVFTS